MKISKVEPKQQVQHLLPVISKQQVLLGMIQSKPLELDGTDITIDNRTFKPQYLRFEDLGNKVDRSIYCIIDENCNGVSGFIPSSKLGIFSIWATPVFNPSYLRSTLGLVEFLTTSKYDSNHTFITREEQENPVSSDDPKLVSASANVSISKFKDKFSFVEFDWVSVLNARILKCKLKPCEFKSISILQNDTPFRVIFYNSNNTNSIPNLLQIMRIGEVTAKTYEFVFDVEGSYPIMFKLALNVKS